MKHKHYDAIIAYANGETIQMYRDSDAKWQDVRYPAFDPCLKYRVKPTTVTRYLWAIQHGNDRWSLLSSYRTPEEMERDFVNTNYTQVPNSGITFEDES